jgi:hypothetical protein
MFHPKFGTLMTIKHPPDCAAAAPIEAVQTKTRIRRSVLAEMYLGFMGRRYAPDSLLASAAFIDFRVSRSRMT